MVSGGFTAAYEILGPQFEDATGKTLVTAYGASSGGALDSIPERLARGEPADLIILSRSSLDNLTAEGRVRAASRVDLGSLENRHGRAHGHRAAGHRHH